MLRSETPVVIRETAQSPSTFFCYKTRGIAVEVQDKKTKAEKENNEKGDREHSREADALDTGGIKHVQCVLKFRR